MTEPLTFLGSALRGDTPVPVPALRGEWALAVTRRGMVISSAGTASLTPKQARALARGLHRAARLAEVMRASAGGEG